MFLTALVTLFSIVSTLSLRSALVAAVLASTLPTRNLEALLEFVELSIADNAFWRRSRGYCGLLCRLRVTLTLFVLIQLLRRPNSLTIPGAGHVWTLGLKQLGCTLLAIPEAILTRSHTHALAAARHFCDAAALTACLLHERQGVHPAILAVADVL